jgi:predicted SAM-dependent methyltransferase
MEELERRLREAEFDKIERAEWGASEHAELRNRETRKETLLICEATK